MGIVHRSFEPIVDPECTVLILGSMPGALSLKEARYYAHPQNMFWKLMFSLFGRPFSSDYAERKQLLLSHGIALWDVLQHCEREGSLDSNILNEVPNNFSLFFESYPNIKEVLFNGQAAYKYFKKYIGLNPSFSYHQMPSTSPAHASKPFEEKRKIWQGVLGRFSTDPT